MTWARRAFNSERLASKNQLLLPVLSCSRRFSRRRRFPAGMKRLRQRGEKIEILAENWLAVCARLDADHPSGFTVQANGHGNGRPGTRTAGFGWRHSPSTSTPRSGRMALRCCSRQAYAVRRRWMAPCRPARNSGWPRRARAAAQPEPVHQREKLALPAKEARSTMGHTESGPKPGCRSSRAGAWPR